MAADEKKGAQPKQITEKERMRYIGFDVFPGTPKDLFKSDAEKGKYVDAVIEKRNSGEVIREECTLLEERVSLLDRAVLTAASLVMIVALFLPWFSAYNETVEESTANVVPQETPIVDSAALAAGGDSLMMMTEGTADSAAMMATEVAEGTPAEAIAEETPRVSETGGTSTITEDGEEVLHSYVAKKKIHKEYSKVSGFGIFLSIGSLGSYVFSSGFILMLTGVLVLLTVLSCLLVPIYNFYGLFALKGDPDQRALTLKKILRFNWLPLVLFVVTFLLSFLGASYGFSNPQEVFTSIGTEYGIGVFFGSLSTGVIVALCASILAAVKSVEI